MKPNHIRIMAASTIPLLLTLAMTASGIAAPADLPSAPETAAAKLGGTATRTGWLGNTFRGAYAAGPPGHQLNLNGEFASLHALRSGNYTLTLPPGRKRVADADTGKVLSSGVREFTFPVQAQHSYWFLFE